jgi:hypothetical protein
MFSPRKMTRPRFCVGGRAASVADAVRMSAAACRHRSIDGCVPLVSIEPAATFPTTLPPPVATTPLTSTPGSGSGGVSVWTLINFAAIPPGPANAKRLSIVETARGSAPDAVALGPQASPRTSEL